MAHIYTVAAFAFGGAALAYGGISILRNGLDTYGEEKMTGPAANTIGYALIGLGVALPIAAHFYFASIFR